MQVDDDDDDEPNKVSSVGSARSHIQPASQPTVGI